MRMQMWASALALLAIAGCGSDDNSASSTTTPDARQRAHALARDDIACTQDSDCCVVFELCQNEGYVVSSKDKDTASSLLASADKSNCNLCVPPPIQVSCSTAGVCSGAKISCTSSTYSDQALVDAAKDHCGKVTLPADCSVTTPQSTSKAVPPGMSPQTVIGCGS